ncbi:MAG TPA: methyltransferase domain-containing protein [Herpetosiphonaceae bacterium]|nr:methyltransferase domain-containing protein [Herpetosiphonaceae bacterium]
MTDGTTLPNIDLLRMPFDQFGRYQIIAEVANGLRSRLGVPQLRILDVGGYQVDERFGERLPLTVFLPEDSIAALDTIPSDLPNYYQGDGTAMPFEDAAFDLVVTADTLEHIPAALRQKFVAELTRVSRYGVALVAPFFSPETELAEIVLDRYFMAELRYKHPFLQEHRDFGLPRVDQTAAWFAEQGCVTADFPSGYVHSWLEMMVLRSLLWRLTGDDALVGTLEEYYNRVLFPVERREPAYRHLIVAAPPSQPALVEAANAVIAPTVQPPVAPPSAHEQFLQQFLLQLMPMGLLDRMRRDDEATVTHWQGQSHTWHVEANRVEVARKELEARLHEAHREIDRLTAQIQAGDQATHHWQSEANRVEVERQALEREVAGLKQKLAQAEAERDSWRAQAQRPLLDQVRSRLK